MDGQRIFVPSRQAEATPVLLPGMSGSATQFVWSKLAAAKWEEEWKETLRYLGETRLAVFELPGGKRIRLELYGLGKAEAGDLVAHFGGSIRPMKPEAYLAAGAGKREPLKIRNRLVIVESAAQAKEFPGRTSIVVPAGAAFGTGDHATTATCLRMLSDLAERHRDAPWDFLDLGTGSGILAIAGRVLGARRVDALDFDADSVRIAKENVRANGGTHIVVKRNDVTAWIPARTWDVVIANLFSSILVKAAPAITAAVAPGGALVLSGILRTQEEEVLAAYRPRFVPERIVHKGKWVAVLASRSETS